MIEIDYAKFVKYGESHSDDPITQVTAVLVGIPPNKHQPYSFDYGTNHMTEALRGSKPELLVKVFRVLNSPYHPAKNMFVRHAEIDAMLKCLLYENGRLHNIKTYIMVCSLQPCLDCVKAMIHAGVDSVYWLTDNRHQDQQEAMTEFLPYVFKNYKKVEVVDGMIRIDPEEKSNVQYAI